jgi:hypothetical protein
MSSLSPASKLLSLIGTAVAVLPAQAEQFSWQLSGVSSRTEIGDLHYDYDSWAIDGTYYANPIDDSAGPYGLASFLNPTTRVSAATSRRDFGFFDDRSDYTLGGAYVLPGERWYVGADYSKTAMDWPQPITRDDEEGYGLLAGRYLGANTTLELGLGRSKRRFENTIDLCSPPEVSFPCSSVVEVPYAEETTTDSVSFDVFHVRRFRSLTYSLQGSVSQSEAEFDVTSQMPSLFPAFSGDGASFRVYSVAGELFPTNRLGVRVGYSRPGGDAAEIDTYDVTTTWFFKPRVALQFGLSRTSVDDVASDPESVAVRFIGRL